ncbi:MAG: L-threonylcarbamoyladenylate synthase [Patescibacteria group bacterium]|nr:L-threonylcarbamoyladenylate synthase [Patescibacteria group bacterium]
MQDIIQKIKNGQVGILPTDTLYGLVGSALNSRSVERIYQIKKRDLTKPLIVLISSIQDLNLFKIKLEKWHKDFLEKYWPGEVSVILNCPNEEFKYLHRGSQTLAVRLPDKPDLIDLIQQTGPLVAPSANPENSAPALNIQQAQNYFGQQVDFYVDQGELNSSPSTLVDLTGEEIKVLRQGKVKIKNV